MNPHTSVDDRIVWNLLRKARSRRGKGTTTYNIIKEPVHFRRIVMIAGGVHQDPTNSQWTNNNQQQSTYQLDDVEQDYFARFSLPITLCTVWSNVRRGAIQNEPFPSTLNRAPYIPFLHPRVSISRIVGCVWWKCERSPIQQQQQEPGSYWLSNRGWYFDWKWRCVFISCCDFNQHQLVRNHTMNKSLGRGNINRKQGDQKTTFYAFGWVSLLCHRQENLMTYRKRNPRRDPNRWD